MLRSPSGEVKVVTEALVVSVQSFGWMKATPDAVLPGVSAAAGVCAYTADQEPSRLVTSAKVIAIRRMFTVRSWASVPRSAIAMQGRARLYLASPRWQ